MGVKKFISKVGGKAADKVANLAALSPQQLEKVDKQKEEYFNAKPDPTDATAVELTSRLLAASSVEIYNSYLPQLSQLYVPVENTAEFGTQFDANYNIRYVNITKWVTDKDENSIEKLINVYEVLSNEECNIALIFHRNSDTTNVFLAVTNTKNEHNNNVADYMDRLVSAIKGNFPGSELGTIKEGTVPCLRKDEGYKYSIASASNIPTEKSEKFISQTIEKILDGIVPENADKDYTVILLATPIQDVEERKNKLSSFYSALHPYSSWQTNYTYTQSDSTNSMALVGINVGASAGVQNTQSSSVTDSRSNTDSSSTSNTDSTGQTNTNTAGQTNTDTTSDTITDTNGTTLTDSSSRTASRTRGTTYSSSNTHTEGVNASNASTDTYNASATASVTPGGIGGSATAGYANSATDVVGTNASDAITSGTARATTAGTSITTGQSTAISSAQAIARGTSRAIANSASRSIANSVGHAVARTFGQAVTTGVATMAGVAKATNFGMNMGANFARSSTVTATVGKNEGITQSFVNYNIKHTLEKLEQQMKRYETGTALGMWDFATYVVSQDVNVANNVAHSYVALTQGEESYMSQAAINLWRGDVGEKSADAKEIYNYLVDLRHPVFGLNPNILLEDETFLVYPNLVNATTTLSGKELACSLNFPRKSIPGLPVFECAEFGRNVVTYNDENDKYDSIRLGQVFHMNQVENAEVDISLQSLASHTFITGSTGSGKSNTIYTMLDRAIEKGIKFLVIEPAKGEYKNVFGNDFNVNVYGTNPKISKLLKINPFSFPESIHVLEHMDRLVEIFNVCWPMYAAMPAVLKDAIEKAYSDCGWDLINSTNRFGDYLYPGFADVARNVRSIIESSEYDNENKGAYKGSLLTRLQSLTNGLNGMIFSQDEIPSGILFDENAIVDISRVGSSETKSLIMGMLVLKLQEYRLANHCGMNSPLKHITVLEEAHNILKRTSTEQPSEGANLLGKSVEMISNAIAEMRTYGEGFIIADQAPGLMDMAVIRNTNTKIIMRLPDLTDRELVGYAANLNENQIVELAKIPCGVAAVYQNEWIQPILCKIDRIVDDTKSYMYKPSPRKTSELSIDKRLKIAEILSQGTALKTEKEISEYRKTLSSLRLDAFIQVSVLKILENPPKEPRMTKLAPIMNALFPEITEAVESSYAESHVASEWTEAANNKMKQIGIENIDVSLRRDIIQGIITYYCLNKLDDISTLKEWSMKGGLS